LYCIVLYCREVYITQKEIHISVDDTIYIFKDLTENQEKYNSIFENETLSFLKKCNEQYGAKFSMYCFAEYGDMKLSECTGAYKQEFIENKDWLNFGFHAFDCVVDYSKCSTEVARKRV